MSDAIKRFIKERNIKYLFHFTSINNIENILKYGLLSVEDLCNRTDIIFHINDEKRLDNRLDAICTSIEFPNYKMFYSCRQQSKNENWCIIELDANILANKRCLFNIENAASKNERFRFPYEKQGIEALKALFYDDYGIREDLGIPSYYTTNPQAEVQVLEKIEVEYINAIHFEKYQDKKYFDRYIGYKYNISSRVTKELFRWRCDFKYWKKVG